MPRAAMLFWILDLTKILVTVHFSESRSSDSAPPNAYQDPDGYAYTSPLNDYYTEP